MGPDTVRHFTYSFFLKICLTKLLFPTCLFIHVIGTAIFPVTQTGNFRLLNPPLTLHIALKLVINLL